MTARGPASGSLATAAALSLAVLSGSAQAPALRIVSASPTGDSEQLADAGQIRIIFSEPMVALGTPNGDGGAAMAPTHAGGDRELLLVGHKDAHLFSRTVGAAAVRDTFTVRVDATAASVAGRALGSRTSSRSRRPPFGCSRPTSYRKGGRFDDPAVLVLRFNQPVRPDDVLAHARVVATPHAWTAPQLSPQARERLQQTDPSGLARFDDKVAAVLRVTSSSDSVAVRLAGSWNEQRFPRSPDRVVLETASAPPPDMWLTIALDDRLPSAQGPRTPAAQSAVVQLEPAFFVQRIWCEGLCAMSEFGPPFFRQPGFNPISLSASVARGAFARALAIADVTDGAGERAVLATTRRDDERARQLAPGASPMDSRASTPSHRRRLATAARPDLRASDGQTLGYPWVGFVETVHAQPFVPGAFDGSVWEAGGGPLVPFTTRNVSR